MSWLSIIILMVGVLWVAASFVSALAMTRESVWERQARKAAEFRRDQFLREQERVAEVEFLLSQLRRKTP